MAKYHDSPVTGKMEKCSGKCKYGEQNAVHIEAANAKQAEEKFTKMKYGDGGSLPAAMNKSSLAENPVDVTVSENFADRVQDLHEQRDGTTAKIAELERDMERLGDSDPEQKARLENAIATLQEYRSNQSKEINSLNSRIVQAEKERQAEEKQLAHDKPFTHNLSPERVAEVENFIERMNAGPDDAWRMQMDRDYVAGIEDDEDRVAELTKFDKIAATDINEGYVPAGWGDPNARAWNVTLRDENGDEILTTTYTKGSALGTDKPTAGEVMHAVVQDAYSYHTSGGDYDQWRADMGYDASEDEAVDLEWDVDHPDYDAAGFAFDTIQAEYDEESSSDHPNYDRLDALSDQLYEAEQAIPKVDHPEKAAFKVCQDSYNKLNDALGTDKLESYFYAQR